MEHEKTEKHFRKLNLENFDFTNKKKKINR